MTWVRPFGVPDPDRPLPPSSFDEEAGTRVSYDQTGDITAGGVGARLAVEVHRDGARRFGARACKKEGPDPTTVICEEGTGPNGERLLTVGTEHREKGRGGSSTPRTTGRCWSSGQTAQSSGFGFKNMRQDGRFPLSVDQQTAVALDPAVALAPLPPGVVLPSAEPRPTPANPPSRSGSTTPSSRRCAGRRPRSRARAAPTGAPTDLASVWGDSGGENTADSYWGQGRIISGRGDRTFRCADLAEGSGLLRCSDLRKADQDLQLHGGGRAER